MDYTEHIVRDAVIRALCVKLGVQDSFQGEGETARFTIENDRVRATCAPEGALHYNLPGGNSLSHKSDILITIEQKNSPHSKRYVSIEIKHKSAVTDQFKTRSYDMLHLKQSYGSRIYGIMLYARAGQGISFENAAKICYPFDRFIRVDYSAGERPEIWNELAAVVSDALVVGADAALPTP